MWKACCNVQTTQSPGIGRVHKEHGQNYHTLCIVSDVDTGRQHRVWPGIERVHKERQQSSHMLCIVSDVKGMLWQADNIEFGLAWSVMSIQTTQSLAWPGL